MESTTKEMIDTAHKLGLQVKPYTVNRMNIVEQLLDWKADGIISDCASHLMSQRLIIICGETECLTCWIPLTDPNVVRRLAKHRGLPVAPKFPKQRVLSCLQEHLAKQVVRRYDLGDKIVYRYL